MANRSCPLMQVNQLFKGTCVSSSFAPALHKQEQRVKQNPVTNQFLLWTKKGGTKSTAF